MTDIERGPLQTYQVIWRSGLVEEIKAHQVLLPIGAAMFGESDPHANRITFHGEIDGRWMLILDADYSDIQSVRRLDNSETIA